MRAGDHIGGELIADTTSKPSAAMRGGFSRAPRSTRPKREATMRAAEQIRREQAGEA